MPEHIRLLKAALERRGMRLEYFAQPHAARQFVIGQIPAGATVMNGGSATLQRIGLLDALLHGQYDYLRPLITATCDREARTRLRRRASGADYFVGGVNAITMQGEILNADGGGNRVAAYAYTAGKVFLVAGTNKIVPDIAAAFERLRNQAAVGECRALGKHTPCAVTGRCDNYACEGPDRQCGKVLIIEHEKIAGRITVVLIGEALGY
jgi:LUD domain